jgi:DNA-binding winged helix-turn-helix (wHTH) protein/tetratricopeptide (TPR) repeat protein
MLLKKQDLIRFDSYGIDRPRWILQWQDEPITLNRKTFDLLLYLIDHRERVVGKDELLHALWPDQFVEESNLTQHVFLLRKALSHHPSGRKIIENVPGRGYRFTAIIDEPVGDEVQDQLVIAASESITRFTIEEQETDAPSGISPGDLRALGWRRHRFLLFGAPLATLVIASAGWFAWQRWLDRTGGSPVQVVVVPMEGSTGDTILDKSLTQALRMDLAQSPYVSVVPSSTVQATLTQMQHKPDEVISSATAREVCERTNSQSFLSGNIARIGQRFLITDEATSCVDGSTLGIVKYEAASAEELPHAIDKLAANLRQKLGESRRSIARFDVPLFHDNTPSLEALKAFTVGTQLIREGKMTDAIGLLKSAIAADPQLASAYYNLAAIYASTGDDLHEREAIAKAYSLKDTAMKPAQFAIAAMYDSDYTGDMYDLLRSYQRWADLYPNSSQAWSGLANAERDLTMDAEALASSLRTIQLLPHSQGMLANLALDQMRNGDLKGARASCERAIHNNLDGDGIRVRYLQLAYLLKDAALLKEQEAWAEAHPQGAAIIGTEAQIAMAEGRFADAEKLIARDRDVHHQQGLSGPDEERAKFSAVEMMQAGEVERGKKIFQESPVDIEVGQENIGLVYVGDIPGALAAIHANEIKYPRATMTKTFWIPRQKAAIAMAEHKPAEAAALLEIARPFDTGGRVVPWLRGNAYLAAGQPVLAEKDYRSMVTHPEFDPTSPYIPLSWLGLGEALAAQGRKDEAIAAYQHFFTLWAHADPDAMYLRQAKQEFAKLKTSDTTAS